mgnify:CR=1 FL=1
MSEWFYIRRWRANEAPVWSLIDREQQLIILEDVTMFEAMAKQHELENKKLQIVNKFDSRYNSIIDKFKKRKEHEDCNSERRI